MAAEVTRLGFFGHRAITVASTLIPCTGSVEKYPLREQHPLEFNAALPALVKKHQAAGQQVVFHDMRAQVRPGHISADGVHPNQAGYNFIADGRFDALKVPLLMKNHR